MSDERWSYQSVSLGALVAFVGGTGLFAFAGPTAVLGLTKPQLLDAGVVLGLLALGALGAHYDEDLDALTYGLAALGYGTYVAPTGDPRLTTIGAISCVLAIVVVAHSNTRRSKAPPSTSEHA